MAGYIEPPIETDAEELATDALDYLTANIPGFVPQDGHLEVFWITALARIVAEARDVASRVPTSIFRFFGQSLLGLPAIDAAPARVASTWTMIDTLGYTIPADTLAAFRVAGDELVAFRVESEVEVPPGSLSTNVGGVVMVAVDEGTVANDIPAGAMELIDGLAFVDTIVSTTATSGGVDAESDEDYLDRLREELQISSPRPILPNDFAVIAKRVAGVHRAVAIDGHNPNAVNELQSVDIADTATGGTFTLTFGGQTTAGIAFNATAADVVAALEALANVAPGDVAATGGPLPAAPVVVEFQGAFAFTDVGEMTIDPTALTPAGQTGAVTTTRQGLGPQTGNARMISVAVVDSAGAAVAAGIKTEVETLLESMREVNWEVHVIDPTYTAIDVTFTAVAKAGYDAADVETRAEAAVIEYFAPSRWGGGDQDPPEWRHETIVRYGEVWSLIDNVDGVDYVDTLAVEGGVVNVVLAGVAPLTTAGIVDGTVTVA